MNITLSGEVEIQSCIIERLEAPVDAKPLSALIVFYTLPLDEKV